MYRLLGMVAWTITAIALLPFFTSRVVYGQATDANEVRDDSSRDDSLVAERVAAERYEQLLIRRPQMGSAFDKFYELHSRQGTIAELCERLKLSAASGEDGNLFQLLGLLQLRRGFHDDAVASLNRAESLLPNEPLVGLYLSRALSIKRQYAPALTALKIAADRKPTQAVALEILTELMQLKDRDIADDVAVELLSNLEQQFSSNPQVIERLADCLIDFGHPEAARPEYEKLIELTRDPLRRIELRMRLARLKRRLGEPDQSLSELEQLIGQVKPQSWLHTQLLEQIEQLAEELQGPQGLVEYLQRLAEASRGYVNFVAIRRSLSQSQFEEASVWISKAIEAAPESPAPLVAMVDLMEQSKQIKRALECMQQLALRDPSNADYIVRLGHLAAIEPNVETPIQQSNAAAIWRRLLIGHENDPAKAIQVADLLRGISLSNEALELYEQAVQVSGGKIEFSELLGEYLVEMERLEEARGVFLRAITAAGDDSAGLIGLSELLVRFKFRDEALTALDKACENRANFSDLIQMAKLQSDCGRFEAALDTLNRAAIVAESSADWLAVWDSQASVFKGRGGLPEKISALEKSLPEAPANSIDPLQRLAIMQAVDKQPIEAAVTALKATVLQPDSVRAWLLSSRLQRDAGLSLRELESLGVLCKLDARHSPEYLQRMAAIQFQLNQFDEALATTERILALPTATLQNFHMAASFFQQAKQSDQAFEIMHRATQAFPNERTAWLMLARQLVELRNHRQSIDVTWRVLELSPDQAQQREAIELLATLHPGELGVANLLMGLKQFGIEHDLESDADLWSAWVLLNSGGVAASSELIANLLKSKAKPEILRAAVELAERNRDYSQAVAIQQRLCREAATVGNQLKLGELLWLAGDAHAASIEWKNVIRYGSNDLSVAAFAKRLFDQANWKMVADLVDLSQTVKSPAWEVLALGIHANVQDNKFSRAAELAENLLALESSPGSMFMARDASRVEADFVPITATDRLAWLEQAGAWQATLNVVDVNRAGYRTNQSNPRASQAAAVRHLALQRGAALRSTSSAKFNVQCFAEARALAVLTKFGKLSQERAGVTNDWASYVAEAIDLRSVEKLWDCVLVMEPASCRAISFTAAGVIEYRDANDEASNRYVEVLDSLVAMGESAAVELAINEIVLRRQLQHQMADRLLQAVPAMDAKELTRLQNLIQQVGENDVVTTFAGHLLLAVELMRANQVEEGQRVLGNALAAITEISRLATCARQFLSNDKVTQQATSQVLLRAFELELMTGNESHDLAFAISSFRGTERAAGSKSEDLLFPMIRLQAKHVEGLSADLFFSDSRSNESRRVFRSFRKAAAAIPDRSSLLSASLRAAVIDSAPTELIPSEPNLSPVERLARTELALRWFTASVAQSILNEPDRALQSLENAKEQEIAIQIVSLYEVWLLVANQRLEQAFEALSKIEAPNEAILRECELWKMEIGAKLGNREEARRAASALAKLPLSVQENAEVAAVLSR